MITGPRDDSIPGDGGLLPQEIFGEKHRATTKEWGDSKKVRVIAKKVFNFLDKSKETSVEKLRKYVMKTTSGDKKIAYLVLKILTQHVQEPEKQQMIQTLTAEFCNILYGVPQKASATKLEFLSPKQVSLKEGELPAIPDDHRAAISQYLKGDLLLRDVVDLLGLSKDSARVILRSLKVIDLETDRLSSTEKSQLKYTHSTYELRTLCLQASEGEMNTYEAYTKSCNPEYFTNQFSPQSIEYASHEYNYIPERIRDHSRVVQNYAIEAMQLSKRLGLPNTVYYCIGGNTAVGKSRCAKTDDAFSKGLLEGEIVGSLNLDTLKGKLRKGVDKVTNQQVHAEGAVVARKLASELQNKAIKASLVIDERLGTMPTVQQIVRVAEKAHARLRYKDIDGSLMVSCLRVITRDIKTEPCIPFNPISGGQQTIRAQRKDVLKVAQENPVFESYQLFVADDKGNQFLAAEKKDGVFTVLNEELYQKSQQPITTEEIEAVKNQVISDEFLREASQMVGVKIDELKKYKGMTIEQALERHSKELPKYLS